MSAAKHTPTPWYTSGKVIVGATPDDGQIGGAHDPADAEFIVRACNCHADLLAALQALTYAIDNASVDKEIEVARAAIAKATGET